MKRDQEDEIEIDLRELVVKLISRAWFIIFVTILVGGSTFAINKLVLTPQYTSTTKMYILTKSQSLSSLSLSDLQVGTQLTQDYIVLVQSRSVMEEVISNLNLNMEYDELQDIMTITNPSDTRILVISVEYPDAYMAKQIVDEIAEVSCARIAQIMDADEPNIVENGYVATSPSSPHVVRNTAIGALVGFLASIVLISSLFLLDDTIRNSDDVEKYLGIATLGTIPMRNRKMRSSQ